MAFLQQAGGSDLPTAIAQLQRDHVGIVLREPLEVRRANLVNVPGGFMLPCLPKTLQYFIPRSCLWLCDFVIGKSRQIPKCLALQKAGGKLLLTSVAGSLPSSCFMTTAGKDIKQSGWEATKHSRKLSVVLINIVFFTTLIASLG